MIVPLEIPSLCLYWRLDLTFSKTTRCFWVLWWYDARSFVAFYYKLEEVEYATIVLSGSLAASLIGAP